MRFLSVPGGGAARAEVAPAGEDLRTMTRTISTNGSGGSEDRSHQEKLAFSLVQNLGIDGAIHACQANSWDGVLEYVRGIRGAPGALGA